MLYNLIPSKHYTILKVVFRACILEVYFLFHVSSYMFRCSNLYATNREIRSRQKYLDKMFKIYFVYFGNSKSVKYKWKIYND